MLQRSLLPEDAADVAGLEIAGRYLPAAARASAATGTTRSSWAGGRIAIAVGDVVGHGTRPRP